MNDRFWDNPIARIIPAEQVAIFEEHFGSIARLGEVEAEWRSMPAAERERWPAAVRSFFFHLDEAR